MNWFHCTKITFLLLSVAACPALAAEKTNDPYADYLLNNWGGFRSTLADAGIDTVVEYQGDFMRNAAGGIKRGDSYLDNLDVKLLLDGEKLFGIQGNRALIYFLNNDGGNTWHRSAAVPTIMNTAPNFIIAIKYIAAYHSSPICNISLTPILIKRTRMLR